MLDCGWSCEVQNGTETPYIMEPVRSSACQMIASEPVHKKIPGPGGDFNNNSSLLVGTSGLGHAHTKAPHRPEQRDKLLEKRVLRRISLCRL